MKRIKIIFFLILFFCLFSLAKNSWATVYESSNFESQSCNQVIRDEYIDGWLFDTGTYPEALAEPYVRCSIATSDGSKYMELNVPQVISNQEPHGTGPEIDHDPAYTLTSGTTYYLAANVRFERIGGADIWHDTSAEEYSFDKLLEFSGLNTRWGISSGWQGFYTGINHKFTFDIWCADTSFVGCQTEGNPDHKVPNQNGYSAANPYLADYETWYAVVIAITMNTTTSGNIKLYVNGTLLTDRNQVTMGSGASIGRIYYTGTISQPSYDAPSHKRQIDAILLTNNLQDVVDGGYLLQSQSDTTPPVAPSGITVI